MRVGTTQYKISSFEFILVIQDEGKGNKQGILTLRHGKTSQLRYTSVILRNQESQTSKKESVVKASVI